MVSANQASSNRPLFFDLTIGHVTLNHVTTLVSREQGGKSRAPSL